MGNLMKGCGTCGYSYTGKFPNTVACGAPVDDAAIKVFGVGKNPIWAERKYSILGLLTIVTGEPLIGVDCDAMSLEDGKRCALWREKNSS